MIQTAGTSSSVSIIIRMALNDCDIPFFSDTFSWRENYSQKCFCAFFKGDVCKGNVTFRNQAFKLYFWASRILRVMILRMLLMTEDDDNHSVRRNKENIWIHDCHNRIIISAIFSSFLNRSATLDYNRCSSQNVNNFYQPPSAFAFNHHSSFDELSSAKMNRNLCNPTVHVNFADQQKAQPEYQWPKVIPKSPSSFSMNSFRLHRQPTFNKCPNYNQIDEFDLDRIESERRKSHTTLFKEKVKGTDFGTAV